MKANELRIGNYVKTQEWECMKVESILGGTLRAYLHTLDEEYLADFALSAIEPIPLTEEWLVKLGFVQDGIFCDYILKLCDEKMLGYSTKHSRIYLAQSYKGHNFRDVNLGEFKYLHDLQNLYYILTQTELAIS